MSVICMITRLIRKCKHKMKYIIPKPSFHIYIHKINYSQFDRNQNFMFVQNVLGLTHFKALHKKKTLFRQLFYLIESHLESKNHLVTLDCFCMAVLREDSV